MEIEHALKERKEENLLITFKISQNLVLVPVRFLGGGRGCGGADERAAPATADVIAAESHLEVCAGAEAAGTFPG